MTSPPPGTRGLEVRRLERRVRRLHQLIALDFTIILVLVGLAVLLLLDPLAGP